MALSENNIALAGLLFSDKAWKLFMDNFMEQRMGKILQDRVMTAIVGSYPKPEYLSPDSGRALLDAMGMTFYDLAAQLGQREFQARLDRAALEAISDQNDAGINLITDGEERRGHYVLYVLRKLAGIDFQHLTEKPIRGGRYVRRLPTVIGPIAYREPILVDDFEFTRKHAQGIPKIGLPGPSTVVDSVADAHYGGERERMAWDYAQAIRHEVENLVQAGCRAIQFDDPVLLRYPEQAQEWGLEALQACFRGLEDQATFFVHICRGYPDKPLERKGIAYKAKAAYYAGVLSWLSQSTIDIISIEGTQTGPSSPSGQAPSTPSGQAPSSPSGQGLDLSVLPAAGKKTVMLGVLDVGSNRVESVESLAQRGREALRYLPPEQLILAPDCGMLQLSPAAARQKLANLAGAARELNGQG
jgi:5-methyltetrahydropteroyltriglutamate--homocysteine methyltransferase